MSIISSMVASSVCHVFVVFTLAAVPQARLRAGRAREGESVLARTRSAPGGKFKRQACASASLKKWQE
ncbi:MAG: hypothetical protein ABIF28_10260 [Pseudomonadota bacterium]